MARRFFRVRTLVRFGFACISRDEKKTHILVRTKRVYNDCARRGRANRIPRARHTALSIFVVRTEWRFERRVLARRRRARKTRVLFIRGEIHAAVRASEHDKVTVFRRVREVVRRSVRTRAYTVELGSCPKSVGGGAAAITTTAAFRLDPNNVISRRRYLRTPSRARRGRSRT